MKPGRSAVRVIWYVESAGSASDPVRTGSERLRRLGGTGVVSVRAGLPGGCINQGEAAGQPVDPALTSATLGTGGVGSSGTAVR